VAAHAWTVTGEHVAAARIEGLTEDQVFELVICAALGKASRQLRAARAAADEAERIAAPKTQGRDRA
jgi:alkylhydroperoxidase/carboxymuconolactone decarboxylase family protein YurZ